MASSSTAAAVAAFAAGVPLQTIFEAKTKEIDRLVEQLTRCRWALHSARMKANAIEKEPYQDLTKSAELAVCTMEIDMHRSAIASILKYINICATARIDG